MAFGGGGGGGMPNRSRPHSSRGSDARWEQSREPFNPWVTEYRQMYVNTEKKTRGGANSKGGRRPGSAAAPGGSHSTRKSAWARERQSSHAFDEDRRSAAVERYQEDLDAEARVLQDMDDEARAAFMKAKAEQRERQLRRRAQERQLEEAEKGTPSYLRRGLHYPLRSTQKWLASRQQQQQQPQQPGDKVASKSSQVVHPPFHNYGRNHVSPHRDLGEMHLTFNVRPAQAQSKAPTPQVHAHSRQEFVRRRAERLGPGTNLAEAAAELPERRPVEKIGRPYVMRTPYTPPHELVTPRSQSQRDTASTSSAYAWSEASHDARPPWGWRAGAGVLRGHGKTSLNKDRREGPPPWQAPAAAAVGTETRRKQTSNKSPRRGEPSSSSSGEKDGRPVRLMDADLDELEAIEEDDDDILVDDEEESDVEHPRATSPTPVGHNSTNSPSTSVPRLQIGTPSPRLYPGTSASQRTTPRRESSGDGRPPFSPAGIAPVAAPMPTKLEDAFPKKGEEALERERKIDGIPAGDRRRQLTPRGQLSVVGTPRDLQLESVETGVEEVDAQTFGLPEFKHVEKRHTPREEVSAEVWAAHVPQGRTVPNKVKPGRPPPTPHSPDMPAAGAATKMSQPISFDHPDF